MLMKVSGTRPVPLRRGSKPNVVAWCNLNLRTIAGQRQEQEG